MEDTKTIEDLAEFMYLAYKQEYWEADIKLPIFKNLQEYQQKAWKAAAVVAIQFLETK